MTARLSSSSMAFRLLPYASKTAGILRSSLAPAIAWGFGASRGVASSASCSASNPAQLSRARDDIRELLKTTFCYPILVRLGWHDAGTYDKNIEEWPKRGGTNGSLRFDIELKHGANAGLVNALRLLQPVKDKYSGVTYADLFQLASATTIEPLNDNCYNKNAAGGSKIPMKYGRVDVSGPEQCPEEGRLPGRWSVFYEVIEDPDLEEKGTFQANPAPVSSPLPN